MENAVSVPGRSLFMAGIAPAFVFAVLNLLLWDPSYSLTTRLHILVDQRHLALIAGISVPLGIMLFVLNPIIIHCYEGHYRFERWLLGRAQRRNESLHASLYGDILGLRRMRQALDGQGAAVEPDQRRRADSVAMALHAAYGRLEQRHDLRRLPLTPEFVRPTALGNAYAAMEEYPYLRYGIDAMVFWTRLVGTVPSDYREGIGDQKTNCDVLLNLSLIFGVAGLEALVALVAHPLAGHGFRPEVAIVAVLAPLLAFGLYRAAVFETVMLGKLINSAFDLHRGTLLRQFGLRVPATLDQERHVWLSLGAFVQRGEPFYYPEQPEDPAEHTAPAPPPAGSVTH